MALLGRWAGPPGLIEVTLAPDGIRLLGRWAAGVAVAGFVGRWTGDRSAGAALRGVWYDESARIAERDGLTAVMAMDGGEAKTATLSLTEKAGGTRTWALTRPDPPRSEGRIAAFSFRRREIFDRLTSAAALAERDKKAAAEREALLAASVAETADHSRRVDGAITFIPPLAAAGDAFDDKVLRRHQRLDRHGGKQMLSSVVIADGRSHQNAAVPSVPWMADPFLDRSALTRKLRQERRARSAAAVPAGLRGRKAFRPNNTLTTVAAEADADLVFVSTLVDAETPEDHMRKMATEERERRPATAKHLGRGAESGRLEVRFDPKGFVGGYAHWVHEAEAPLQYMAEDYEAKRKAQRAEWLEEQRRRAGKRAFSPVGPRVTPFHPPEPSESVAELPAAKGTPQAAARSRPATAGGVARGGAGEGAVARPPFYHFAHADPDRYVGVHGEGDVATPAVAKGSAGGAGASPASPPTRPATATGSPRGSRPGTAGGAAAARPGWREVILPAAPTRMVASVATHPLNMAKIGATPLRRPGTAPSGSSGDRVAGAVAGVVADSGEA